MSTIKELQCHVWGRSYDASKIQTYCTDCQAPLLARYDLEAAHSELDRDKFQRRAAGMWRWHELCRCLNLAI